LMASLPMISLRVQWQASGLLSSCEISSKCWLALFCELHMANNTVDTTHQPLSWAAECSCSG
jgi:hypothetical protein